MPPRMPWRRLASSHRPPGLFQYYDLVQWQMRWWKAVSTGSTGATDLSKGALRLHNILATNKLATHGNGQGAIPRQAHFLPYCQDQEWLACRGKDKHCSTVAWQGRRKGRHGCRGPLGASKPWVACRRVSARQSSVCHLVAKGVQAFKLDDWRLEVTLDQGIQCCCRTAHLRTTASSLLSRPKCAMMRE